MKDIVNKILSNEEMAKTSLELKNQGKKVVMVNGVFDLLHAGHIGFLRAAKEKGDVLIVATNTDASVKTYKGEDKPVIPERERVLILASLFFVDYVTLFEESKALRIIEEINPDILVKGIRPDPERLKEEIALMKELGGKVEHIHNLVTTSTGQIIDKIRGIKSG
ncbi:MAG TPA: adenylyltransferase/cytidyltransferase family protein [Candidatus Nanoarchaeia archaeon]|nr:adenylyltransferase/cytidyltransferase family protein [Candidatus Nanoarchaeia archaeon]